MKGKFQESGQLREELWKHKEAAKNKELLKESHLKTILKGLVSPSLGLLKSHCLFHRISTLNIVFLGEGSVKAFLRWS